MQIEQNIIDEVVTRSDIVDVIGKHLKLKRSGQNYFACCPFHNEKSASFSINSVKQFFHCFGCGESGNVITFLMKYSGLEFVDVVKDLADTYGVHIPETTLKLNREQIREQKQQKITLHDILNQVVQLYRNNLVNHKAARQYLANRGLSSEIIQRFLLGYAANDFNGLTKLFPQLSQQQLLRESGLLIEHETRKSNYDRFRDRIIFPIRNIKGDVIAFGGRIIIQGEPKYLNSPETSLFNKSLELYGLFEAQKSIRTHNYVIVVEGYMDVIALNQYGIDNVVATMGTAVTEEQIKKLFRLCDAIYYSFDGDQAGRKAAWRALERSVAHVTDTKAAHFLFLPQEHDPDSFVRLHGSEKFTLELKNQALPLSSFLLGQLSGEVNLNSDEGKARLISLAKPYIEQTKAMALQVMLKKQLARSVELEPQVLESILNNRSRYAFYASKWNKNQLPDRQYRLSTLPRSELVLRYAIKHIDWLVNYRLPESIAHYSQEIQELVLILDYIYNNYHVGDVVELHEISASISVPTINLERVYKANVDISATQEEFQQILDDLFGINKRKVIRIPKIPMRN